MLYYIFLFIYKKNFKKLKVFTTELFFQKKYILFAKKIISL